MFCGWENNCSLVENNGGLPPGFNQSINQSEIFKVA